MVDYYIDRLTYVPSWFAAVIFVAMLLFCLRHKKRRRFWLRFAPVSVAYILIPYLTPHFYVADFFSVGWFSFSYILCVFAAAGIMMLCFEIRLLSLVLYSSAAYAMQNTAFNVYNCVFAAGRIANPAILGMPSWGYALVGLAAYSIVYVIAWFVFVRVIDISFYNTKMRVFSVIVGFVTMLVVYVLDMWLRSRGFLNLGTEIYAILSNLLLLAMQGVILRESRHEMEKAVLSELLRLESKQHKLSEQSINVIELKFHDLKHRLEQLKKRDADDIGEIENAIDTYDAFVKSGNEVLDIVLTQKALICKAGGINMRIIADGAAVSFMSETDISALFGNMLDNAIEAVGGLEEDNKIISLNIFKQKGFVYIHQDNNCAACPVFENGMPVNSAGDNSFHGFGTKSIKHIAEKYGGALSMSCKNNVFSLDILIPERA